MLQAYPSLIVNLIVYHGGYYTQLVTTRKEPDARKCVVLTAQCDHYNIFTTSIPQYKNACEQYFKLHSRR
jgi:hypothetical protein